MKYLRTVEGCIKRDHTSKEDIWETLKYNQYKIKQTKLDETFIQNDSRKNNKTDSTQSIFFYPCLSTAGWEVSSVVSLVIKNVLCTVWTKMAFK